MAKFLNNYDLMKLSASLLKMNNNETETDGISGNLLR